MGQRIYSQNGQRATSGPRVVVGTHGLDRSHHFDLNYTCKVLGLHHAELGHYCTDKI